MGCVHRPCVDNSGHAHRSGWLGEWKLGAKEESEDLEARVVELEKRLDAVEKK